MAFRRSSAQQDAGLKHGWRSGLEEQECSRLKSLGVEYAYEPFVIPWTPLKVRRTYKPDILLLSNYIIVELKGRFVTADRQKHLAVKAEYPDLDLRFVFSNAHQRISKQSQTTYAAWCDAKGFLWAHKVTPAAWMAEPPNLKSRAVIAQFTRGAAK